jgi:putative FmdB family regulatory protein
MPVYEWRCRECGHVFEELQDHFAKRNDKKLCPTCGALATRTINTGTGFRLMGEGWPSVDSGCTPGGSRD